MKKRSILILIILLSLGGGAVYYFGFRGKTTPVSVETVKPTRGFISVNVSATGKIEPVDTVTIGSQVSGTIHSIYADFNDRVKKGELIAELDKSLYETSVNQYSANLELAKSNLVFQQSNYSRQKKLFDDQVISKAEFETSLNQVETARATVSSVQAQMDGAKKNLSYTKIYSPVDGVVLSRNISIGQTVAASFNTPTLFVIAKDITKMQVQAGVDEADIGSVKAGQTAVFSVDAFPDYSFTGQVREIRLQPVVSANVVTYTTIIDAPNKDLKLKPGMTANIFIYTKVDSNVMLIPSRALRFVPDSSLIKQFKILPVSYKHVFKSENSSKLKQVNPLRPKNGTDNSDSGTVQTGRVWIKSGDSLMEREVVTGINDDSEVEVSDGLDGTESVVLAISLVATTGAANTPKSPFMPARRNTAPKAKSPASSK